MEPFVAVDIDDVSPSVNRITDPEAKMMRELIAKHNAEMKQINILLKQIKANYEKEYMVVKVETRFLDIDDVSPSVNQIIADTEAKSQWFIPIHHNAEKEQINILLKQIISNYEEEEEKFLQREKDEKKIFNITAFCTRIRNFFK